MTSGRRATAVFGLVAAVTAVAVAVTQAAAVPDAKPDTKKSAGSAPGTPTPAAPRGPHPRIALGKPALAALKARLGDGNSAATAAVVECSKAQARPGAPSGYQGFDWAVGASACALAWQMTGDGKHAATGVRLWRALLEDVDVVGDGKACVSGATPAQSIAAIRRDSGYAIRFIGVHAALAYDWLYDAPGADEALRKQSRDCFASWLDWYGTQGYLRDVPGANYHAGFVGAKALIAVATSGSGGANDAGGRFWREVVTDLFGKQIVGNGLAGRAGGIPGADPVGALVGGDWPEGWQYGQLSVVEYALAARALADHGATFPEIAGWVDDLAVRFVHGLTPDCKQMYVGGDTGDQTPHLGASAGALLAAEIGPGSDATAAWAAGVRRQLGLARWGPTVFDALAEGRVATARPAAGAAGAGGGVGGGQAAARRPWFLARGTRTLYARSGWDEGAVWTVFTSPPRLVPDHQQMNASGFELSRGGDSLVVDPSPYGSRSTLTGNALTVDSDVVMGDYKPSQTPWSRASLPWARGTAGGVVAARAELAGAFHFNETPSDVPLARRDFVFLPEGELVIVDRVATGGPGRGAYVRFRTPAVLALSGSPPVARGRVGGSALAIHAVTLQPPSTPAVKAVPKSKGCQTLGSCAAARFAVSEYAVKITGPAVVAVHVLDALAADEAPAAVQALADGGVTGVAVQRAGTQTFVVAAAFGGGRLPDVASYYARGAQRARHVVLDAPGAGGGRTAVSALPAPNGRCLITLAASGDRPMPGWPAVFFVEAAHDGCQVRPDPDAP